MHLEEIKHCLEEQVWKNKRLKEAIHAREETYQQAESYNYVYNDENRRGYYNNPFDNIPFSGNDDNNTPPRTPRVNTRACPSPPIYSKTHHESDDEITSEHVMRF